MIQIEEQQVQFAVFFPQMSVGEGEEWRHMGGINPWRNKGEFPGCIDGQENVLSVQKVDRMELACCLLNYFEGMQDLWGVCFPVSEVNLESKLKTKGRGRNNLQNQKAVPPWFFVLFLLAQCVMHVDTFGSTPTPLMSAVCSDAVRLEFFLAG